MAVLFLSLPRFLGAATALPAGPALNTIRKGGSLADEPLDRAVAALEQSLRWQATPASLSDLAVLKLVRLRAGEPIGAEQHRQLAESRAAQEASLAGSPASSNGWARLSYARYALSGLDEVSRGALEMSFLTGRLEYAPMRFRLQLILREWQALDPEMRAAGRAEVRRLARYGQRGLDALVDVYLASEGAGSEIIGEVLAGAPQDRVRFERRLERSRRSR